MSKKIYIGNLSPSVTDKHLLDLFSQEGKVTSVKVITTFDGKTNAGHAYITMSSDSETHNAINKLNNKKLEGKTIRVIEAHPIDQDTNYMFKYSKFKRTVRR